MIVEMNSYEKGYKEGFQAGYEECAKLAEKVSNLRTAQLDALEREMAELEIYFGSETTDVFLALVKKWRGRPYDEEILNNLEDEINDEYNN